MLRLIRDQRENERSKRGRSEFVLIPSHVFGVDVFIGMRIAGFSHNDVLASPSGLSKARALSVSTKKSHKSFSCNSHKGGVCTFKVIVSRF